MFAIAGAMTGCAQPTRESATIDRFVDAPRELVAAAFVKVATARGYRDMGGGTWQRTLTYQKDPILGLVQINDNPATASVLTPMFLTVTPTASRLQLAPQLYQQLFPGWEKHLFYVPPGQTLHGEATSIVDSVVAEALSSHRAIREPAATR